MTDIAGIDGSGCSILIENGKNRGRTCGAVNKRCRHRMQTCALCKVQFTHESSYYRHIRTCAPGPPRLGVIVPLNDPYTDLVLKLGKVEAQKTLAKAVAEKNVMGIIYKLYLDGHPDDFPIAIRDSPAGDQVRYLVYPDTIVDDNGDKLGVYIQSGLRNALLTASSELVVKQTRAGLDSAELDSLLLLQSGILDIPDPSTIVREIKDRLRKAGLSEHLWRSLQK